MAFCLRNPGNANGKSRFRRALFADCIFRKIFVALSESFAIFAHS